MTENVLICRGCYASVRSVSRLIECWRCGDRMTLVGPPPREAQFVTTTVEAIDLLECAADLIANGAEHWSAVRQAVKRKLYGDTAFRDLMTGQWDLVSEIADDIIRLEDTYGPTGIGAKTESPEHRIASLLQTAAALRAQQRAA